MNRKGLVGAIKYGLVSSLVLFVIFFAAFSGTNDSMGLNSFR